MIIDIPGNHRFADCRRALTSDGVYVLIGHDAFGAHGGRWLGSLRRFAGLLVRTPFSPHLKPSFSAPPKPESMAVLQDLLERGLITPEIDRTFGLDQAGEALQHLVAGRARGRIVLVP